MWEILLCPPNIVKQFQLLKLAKSATRTETYSVRSVETSTTITRKRVNWEAENNAVLCIKLHLNPQAVSSGCLQDDLCGSEDVDIHSQFIIPLALNFRVTTMQQVLK